MLKYLLIVISFYSHLALAIDSKTTLCTFQNIERKIAVVYTQDSLTPCEVQYTKEADMQVLWSANAQTGYCEEKAANLVEKLKGWGWQCEAQTKDKPASDDKSKTNINMEAMGD